MNIFKNSLYIKRILFLILVFFMALGGFFHEYFKNFIDETSLLIYVAGYLILCFIIYRLVLKLILSRINK